MFITFDLYFNSDEFKEFEEEIYIYLFKIF